MTFENIEVSHIRHALRGMRNPMSGWDKSDSTDESVGPRDDELAKRLIRAGQPHRKFMRQISVIVDICKMPAYLMHEFATYKVGTTLDCSSTMHKITSRPLTYEDFEKTETTGEFNVLGDVIAALNTARGDYLRFKESGDAESAEKAFRSMKRMLPHSYLYERMTWTCSYENLVEIWKWRHNHRLPAWHQFCEDFIEKLPHAEWITGTEPPVVAQGDEKPDAATDLKSLDRFHDALSARHRAVDGFIDTDGFRSLPLLEQELLRIQRDTARVALVASKLQYMAACQPGGSSSGAPSPDAPASPGTPSSGAPSSAGTASPRP